jgi:hypothetical protein
VLMGLLSEHTVSDYVQFSCSAAGTRGSNYKANGLTEAY